MRKLFFLASLISWFSLSLHSIETWPRYFLIFTDNSSAMTTERFDAMVPTLMDVMELTYQAEKLEEFVYPEPRDWVIQEINRPDFSAQHLDINGELHRIIRGTCYLELELSWPQESSRGTPAFFEDPQSCLDMKYPAVFFLVHSGPQIAAISKSTDKKLWLDSHLKKAHQIFCMGTKFNQVMNLSIADTRVLDFASFIPEENPR